MHPDHARSFVLANSRGGFAVRTPKYTYPRVRSVHRHVETATSSRRVGFAFGRVRTTSSGVLNILRIPFARYLAPCFKTRPRLDTSACSSPISPLPPPSLPRLLLFGMQYFAAVCTISIIQVRRLVDRYQQVFASFCTPWFSLVAGEPKFKGIRVIT